MVIFITLVAALIASLSQLLFKRSMKAKLSSVGSIIRMFTRVNVMFGIAGYLASLGIYLYALSKADLSVVYPAFASSFIFTTILSHFVLKEKIGLIRVTGIALVFLGIATVAITIK